MKKHLRLATAAFAATTLVLAGCADDGDDTTTDDTTTETEPVDDGAVDDGTVDDAEMDDDAGLDDGMDEDTEG